MRPPPAQRSLGELERQLRAVVQVLHSHEQRLSDLEQRLSDLDLAPHVRSLEDGEGEGGAYELEAQTQALEPPWLIRARHSLLQEPRTAQQGADPWVSRALRLIGVSGQEPSTLAWPSAAVAYWIAAAGLSLQCRPSARAPQGRITASAASWLSWGVPLDDACLGCVVVLRRADTSSLAEVGVVGAVGQQALLVLRGSGHHRVQQAWEPRTRVVAGGYRWPSA